MLPFLVSSVARTVEVSLQEVWPHRSTEAHGRHSADVEELAAEGVQFGLPFPAMMQARVGVSVMNVPQGGWFPFLRSFFW